MQADKDNIILCREIFTSYDTAVDIGTCQLNGVEKLPGAYPIFFSIFQIAQYYNNFTKNLPMKAMLGARP